MDSADHGASEPELCDECGINVDSDQVHAGFCIYSTAEPGVD